MKQLKHFVTRFIEMTEGRFMYRNRRMFTAKPLRLHADAIKGLNSLGLLRNLLFHCKQPSFSDAPIEKRKNTNEQIAAL